ncbi:MAG: pyrroloquinoline quinone biosynthesis peptide chaperone PqqD [Paracoccaceae bacterium]
MSEAAAPALDGAAVPFLPRGVRLRYCGIREAWFLLAPERAVRLDPVAAAILQALDGTRDVDAVVAHLAETYQAPRERIGADVRAFLTDLNARWMVSFR